MGNDWKHKLLTTGNGRISCTTENFLLIFQNDARFNDVIFNTLRGAPEIRRNGTRRQWSDADDADARRYIEQEYGLYNRPKSDDAFRVFVAERETNPALDLIRKTKWDGVPRCENFLTRWLKADDTPYTREASRLLFAGGINRLVYPGCKFDSVIVLQGPQGSGKSTVCAWLALEDDFYTSLKTIQGQKGYEAVAGKWLVEIEELLALIANNRTDQKIEENAKAFISTRFDTYRKPYDRRPGDNPRTCIFIGTTNRQSFLTDKTGNRRWFPVEVHSSGVELFSHETEVRSEISQCWAEMLYRLEQNDPLSRPAPNMALLQIIEAHQEDAEIEDPRVGMIEDFLEGKDRVCLRQVWDECLYRNTASPPQMTRHDSNDLAELLSTNLHWKRGSVARFGNGYGRQKCYYPPENAVSSTEIPF